MRLIVILLASIGVATAQSKLDKKRFEVIDNSLFDCLYEYNVGTEYYNTILQVGASVAKFWDYNLFAADSVSYIASKAAESQKKSYSERALNARYLFEPTVLQDYPTGSITVNDVITPSLYAYTEPMGAIEWELSSDTMTVCRYLCNRASATYGGRDWVVWYTPEIPVTVGLWKFNGLPGLVLQAEDSENLHSFRAIAIRQNSLPIYQEKQAGRVKITREKFISNKIEFEKDPMKNIPIEAIGKMQVYKYGSGSSDKTAYINGVRLTIRPSGFIPLELK